jgi:hypothetical protein
MAAVWRGAASGSSRMYKVWWPGMMSPESAGAVETRVWASFSARLWAGMVTIAQARDRVVLYAAMRMA